MKKLLLILTIVAIPVLANAQVGKDRTFLGGSTSFNSSYTIENDGDAKTFDISISPRVGKVVAENFVLGINADLGYTSFSTPNSSSDATILLGGPFLRYYLSDSNVKPFLDAGAGFGKAWGSSDINLFSANVGAGVAVFVNDNVSIDIGLDYTYLRSKIIVESDFFEFEPAHQGNISLSLGVSVFVD